MKMYYDGVLVMPNNYVAMGEEDMTYLSGGYWYSQAMTNFTGKDAYNSMIEARNASYALLAGAATAGGVIANIVGAVIAGGVGTAVFGQWADVYATSAEKLYEYRNNVSLYFSWTENFSGLFHLSHTFTKWASKN